MRKKLKGLPKNIKVQRFSAHKGKRMPNEIRKDYLLDRWVIVAADRAKRPTDFLKTETEKGNLCNCPFCPGNEKMTPPAHLLYLFSNGDLIKERDPTARRIRNWIVRCIPNMYPALSPRKPIHLQTDTLHERIDGIGAHEVIIESPRHDEHPDRASPAQIQLVIQAYIDRLKALSKWEYVSIFRNHKKEGGASLSHAHSQIIATPIIPTVIKEELLASRDWITRTGICPYCEIIESERKGPRFICENDDFIVFAPWASVYPFEIWVIPKRHQHTLLQLKEHEKHGLAQILRNCLKKLTHILHDPPYTFGFHIAPNRGEHQTFHWHLEVYPKLTIHAGFENSTGMYINVTPPELAASSLKPSSGN